MTIAALLDLSMELALRTGVPLLLLASTVASKAGAVLVVEHEDADDAGAEEAPVH